MSNSPLGFCKLPDGSKGEIKSVNGKVVTFYHLDPKNKRIQDGFNIHGEPSYKIGITTKAKILSIQLDLFG